MTDTQQAALVFSKHLLHPLTQNEQSLDVFALLVLEYLYLIKQRQVFCREIYVRFIDLIDFFKFLTVVTKHMYTLL